MNWFEQKSCNFATDFNFIRTYEQLTIDKRSFSMTQEQETEVLRLIKDVDVTELMGMLMKHGNRYSRRILKFFRWY